MLKLVRSFFLFLLGLLSSPVWAQAVGQGPLHSFTMLSPYLGCTGGDYYVNLAGWYPGAGLWPTAPSTIIGVDLHSFGFLDTYDYVMLGKTQPYGDAISPYLYSTERHDPFWFPAGTGYPFDPTQPATQQLHLHYRCVGAEAAWFQLTVTYTTP